jgi:hypothetical protein
VGEVEDFAVTVPDGRPARLTVRRTLLLTHYADIPVDLIQDVSLDGVNLSATREQVDDLTPPG